MTDNTSLVRAVIAAENAARSTESLPALTSGEVRYIYRWGATAPREALRERIEQANAVSGFRRVTSPASPNQMTRIRQLEHFLYGAPRPHPTMTYSEASGLLQHLTSVRRDAA